MAKFFYSGPTSEGTELGKFRSPLPKSITFVFGSQTSTSESEFRSNRTASDRSDYLDENSESTEETSTNQEEDERSPIEAILGYKEPQVPGGENYYYVKLRDRPYRDCGWISATNFLRFPHAKNSIHRYHRKVPTPFPPPYYDASWDKIERVIACSDLSKDYVPTMKLPRELPPEVFYPASDQMELQPEPQDAVNETNNSDNLNRLNGSKSLNYMEGNQNEANQSSLDSHNQPEKQNENEDINPQFLDLDNHDLHHAEKPRKQYLVKWQNLYYAYCTWEVEVEQKYIEEYENRQIPKEIPEFSRPLPSDFQKLESFPSSKSGLTLFEYQMAGLNWLRSRWYNSLNCILADEMGLGKTAQAVTLLSSLSMYEHLPGPFLVIAPLSTLPHWQRQFADWANFNAIIYSGDKDSRDLIRDYEFFYQNSSQHFSQKNNQNFSQNFSQKNDQNPQSKFDVLITSYEYVLKDLQFLQAFKWAVLIVDEAHHLKNSKSKLLYSLNQLQTDFRILLTGTPLQNTIKELQSLLEFLQPGNFADLTGPETANDVIKLRGILQPLLLRRLKADVDQSIAIKEETIIECAMTKTQKQFYKAILEQNAGFLSARTNFSNIFIELRKVCDHPYLIKGAEKKVLEENHVSPNDNAAILDYIVRTSGKMILIDKLLPKLKQDGHRVLIFSQMTSFLDILQDYLAMQGYSQLRIDGQVRAEDRQAKIDAFNAPGSEIFVFLLSTRAGGLGINLNAADTVILFDSDWNPQNDLQAQARCHRIGQHRTVKVYRLVTKGTYEEKMFSISSRKLGLGRALLDNPNSRDGKEKARELDLLLREGAYHLLNDMEEENFKEEDIDQILSRSKTMVYSEAAGGAFSRANFDLSGRDQENVELDDPDFWQKILPNADRPGDRSNDRPNEEDEGTGESRMTTRRKKFRTDDEDDGDGEAEWRRTEREALQHLLSWYGWGRWEEAEKLVKLKRPVYQIKRGARALLRWLVNSESDLSRFTTARTLFEQACSSGFDPSFTNDDDAEMADTEFLKQPTMLDPDFVQTVMRNVVPWLKRLEMMHFLNMHVQKSLDDLDSMYIPKVLGNLPAEWWTEKDDAFLLLGTYRHGYAHYDDFNDDEELKFTCKSIGEPLPPPSPLSVRVKKLAAAIRKHYTGETRKETDFAQRDVKRLPNQWRKRDRSVVLQQLLHAGVQIKEDGSLDWEQFRDVCGFPEKNDEQMEKYVNDMLLDKPIKEDDSDNDQPNDDQNDTDQANDRNDKTNDQNEKSSDQNDKTNDRNEKSNDQNDKDDQDKENSALTATRVRSRFNALVRLRRAIQKLSKEDFAEYIQLAPQWRNVPYGWNPVLETKFFREIAERGWGICGEILKEDEFSSHIEGDPPNFMTQDPSVIKRLHQVLDFIDQNQDLDALRAVEANKPKKAPKPHKGAIPLPDIVYDSDGSPALPIALTSTSWVSDLGHIVSDRPGFHTDRYLYPAGFKSSRMYASTVDPTVRVRYSCEIIDNGGDAPLFRVRMDDNPAESFEGISPTTPWNLIVKKIKENRENCPKALSVSGPEYFGLAAPQIIYLLQKMPGADQCDGYQPKKFGPALSKDATTPTGKPKRKPKEPKTAPNTNSNTNSAPNTNSATISAPILPSILNQIPILQPNQSQQLNPRVQSTQLPAPQHGLQQNLQQGLQQNLQQNLQQGLQQNLQQGLQQNLQQNLQQGLQQNLQPGLQKVQAQVPLRGYPIQNVNVQQLIQLMQAQNRPLPPQLIQQLQQHQLQPQKILQPVLIQPGQQIPQQIIPQIPQQQQSQPPLQQPLQQPQQPHQ